MKDTKQLNHWIKTHGDLALDLVRIYLGIGLIIKAIYFPRRLTITCSILWARNGNGFWFAPALMMQYLILAALCGSILPFSLGCSRAPRR